jgi:hypothetical protein
MEPFRLTVSVTAQHICCSESEAERHLKKISVVLYVMLNLVEVELPLLVACQPPTTSDRVCC